MDAFLFVLWSVGLSAFMLWVGYDMGYDKAWWEQEIKDLDRRLSRLDGGDDEND